MTYSFETHAWNETSLRSLNLEVGEFSHLATAFDGSPVSEQCAISVLFQSPAGRLLEVGQKRGCLWEVVERLNTIGIMQEQSSCLKWPTQAWGDAYNVWYQDLKQAMKRSTTDCP
jgi:hypothetical protein